MIQSQRDCASKPRVGTAEPELPWVIRSKCPNPNVGCVSAVARWRNPVGVENSSLHLPRVARSSAFAWLRRDESQPWALMRNPFGIEGARSCLRTSISNLPSPASVLGPQSSSACVACVTAPPARRAAATIAASTSSASVAPALRALPLWISMQ